MVDKTLVFVHLPKCGGTTLRTHLLGYFDPARVLKVYSDYDWICERVDALIDRGVKLQYVYGHFFYGIHQLLPTECAYITMLREPVVRMASHYHDAKRSRRSGAREQMARHCSLVEYAGAWPWLGYSMVNKLAGIDFRTESAMRLWDRPLDRALIDRAKRNLVEAFDFFGLLERFDDSMKLFQHTFGWDMTNMAPRNVNRARPRRPELSAEEQQEMQRICAGDIELYEFAREKFAERLAARSAAAPRRTLPVRARAKSALRGSAGMEASEPARNIGIEGIGAAPANPGARRTPAWTRLTAALRRCRGLFRAGQAQAPPSIPPAEEEEPGRLRQASWALDRLLDIAAEDGSIRTVLVIGAGAGHHAEVMKAEGLAVTGIDSGQRGYPLDFVGDYLDYRPPAPFDAIWACHVLQQVRNPGLFLDKVFADLRPDGVLAITVPPMRNEVRLTWPTQWNAGLLLLNLIHAGFDCRLAEVATYRQNCSVVVRKRSRADAARRGRDTLPRYLPIPCEGPKFGGRINPIDYGGSKYAAKHRDATP